MENKKKLIFIKPIKEYSESKAFLKTSNMYNCQNTKKK